jgi:hypothetical protein
MLMNLDEYECAQKGILVMRKGEIDESNEVKINSAQIKTGTNI